jgi:hypothetical protein
MSSCLSYSKAACLLVVVAAAFSEKNFTVNLIIDFFSFLII